MDTNCTNIVAVFIFYHYVGSRIGLNLCGGGWWKWRRRLRLSEAGTLFGVDAVLFYKIYKYKCMKENTWFLRKTFEKSDHFCFMKLNWRKKEWSNILDEYEPINERSITLIYPKTRSGDGYFVSKKKLSGGN